MSNKPYTFATRNLKADSVHIPDPDKTGVISDITDLLPTLDGTKRIRNIEFLGQLVKITETTTGDIKVYIGEDKNYPAPSASITSLSGNNVKSYYLYDNGNTWPKGTTNWGGTYANCSINLKDSSDEKSVWDSINISIAGAGDPVNHKNDKGFNIPNDYTLKVTIKIDDVETVLPINDFSDTPSNEKRTISSSRGEITVSYECKNLTEEDGKIGLTPGTIEITDFNITLDPNNMFGSESGGSLYYKVEVIKGEDSSETLCSNYSNNPIFYGLYNSAISAKYNITSVTKNTRTVSGKAYTCEGTKFNIALSNGTNFTNGGTRKDEQIFKISATGKTNSIIKNYDSIGDNNHTKKDNADDTISYSEENITFDKKDYYGSYTITTTLYDGNGGTKEATGEDDSTSYTIDTAAWASPSTSSSSTRENFADSDKDTLRLVPDTLTDGWTWDANRDAATEPDTSKTNGSGKLVKSSNGGNTHVRHIYGTSDKSAINFTITFDKATSWTSDNIKVLCRKKNGSTQWFAINGKQESYKGDYEGICKDSITDSLTSFKCGLPAAVGTFKINEGLFIKIIIDDSALAVYPYTVTFN